MNKLINLSKIEITALINEALLKNNIVTVMSGGSAVEYHSSSAYVSGDIDLVNVYSEREVKIKKVMIDLGFKETNKYYIIEGRKDIFIEFPRGPLGIAGKHLKLEDTDTVKTDFGNFRIISIKDSIKDRLIGFFQWEDRQSLYQATLMMSNHYNKNIIDELNTWASENDEYIIKWNFFKKLVDGILKSNVDLTSNDKVGRWIEEELNQATDDYCNTTSKDNNNFKLIYAMDYYGNK